MSLASRLCALCVKLFAISIDALASAKSNFAWNLPTTNYIEPKFTYDLRLTTMDYGLTTQLINLTIASDQDFRDQSALTLLLDQL